MTGLEAGEASFLSGGGETGALMRSLDWSRTPLGAATEWPQSLRTMVRLMLASRFPMFIAWGPELTFLYNDGYAPLFGARHPAGLGKPFAKVWPDVWEDVEPFVDSALAGEAIFREDLPLRMSRNGYEEDAYFTFSYSPAYGDDGTVAGMLCVCSETTAQVMARLALQSERQYLDDLFQQAPGFMCVLREPDHKFELVNQSFLGLVGERQVLGRRVRDALPDLEGQGFFELLDQVFLSGKAHGGRNFPVTLRRSSGKPPLAGFIDFVMQPISNRSGAVTGIFIQGMDITERVEAERALRQSEQRLRLAIEAGRMAVWDFDAATGTLTGSADLNRLLGFPPDHPLTIEETRERYLPGENQRIRDEAAASLARGERFLQSEYRYRWPDGSVRWHLLRAEVLFGADGAPINYVGIVIDITDRREAEEALRQREQDLTAALNAASMGTYVFDHRDRRLQSSPRLNEIYGYPVDRALTLDDLEARYHPEDLELIERLFREANGEGRSQFEMEFRLLLPDGTVTWVNGTGEMQRNDDGRVISSRGIVRDVSERKQWEERQKLLIDELNHRVKNTLASVQAIAGQTFRTDEDPAAAKQTFAGRLLALAAAHDILTRESWEGAEMSAIVAAALKPFSGGEQDRVIASGPHVRLTSKAALAFALGLHELATNAAKYGALSNEAGKVYIDWRTGGGPQERRWLSVVWRESDGPPVVAPTRNGFGTRLLHRGLAGELDGEAHVAFEPGGVVWRLNCEL